MPALPAQTKLKSAGKQLDAHGDDDVAGCDPQGAVTPGNLRGDGGGGEEDIGDRRAAAGTHGNRRILTRRGGRGAGTGRGGNPAGLPALATPGRRGGSTPTREG